MNERIKLLADEAAKFSAIMALPTGESGDNLFVEKFAELIIKECANMVEEYQPRYLTRGQAQEMADTIKQNFGVEE